MSTPAELMATGMPGAQAAQLGSDLGTALVATGSTKAAALVLVAEVNIFATVSSGKGALLPGAGGSGPVTIYNGGANALSVYAAGTNTINAGSAGAAFSVTNAKSAIFWPAGSKWVATLGA